MKKIILGNKRFKKTSINEGYTKLIGATGELIKELDFLLNKAKSLDAMFVEKEKVDPNMASLIEDLASDASGLARDLDRISKKLVDVLEDYYW